MSENDQVAHYTQQARRAQELVSAWNMLRIYSSLEPVIAKALAAIDTTEMTGPIDATTINVSLAEARAEQQRCTALAELERRRAAAAAGTGVRCTCDHNSAGHARRLADGKLPCSENGCGCQDLVLSPVR